MGFPFIGIGTVAFKTFVGENGTYLKIITDCAVFYMTVLVKTGNGYCTAADKKQNNRCNTKLHRLKHFSKDIYLELK